MNPGIFYFYYYTPNHPPCNVGFLKLNQHFHSCSLEVHIRNIPTAQGDILKLGAFSVKEQVFQAIILSEISAKTNAVFARFDIPESDFPDTHTLSETGGFFLQLADQSIIAATEPGIKFDPGRLSFSDQKGSLDVNTDTAPAAAETAAAIAKIPSSLPVDETPAPDDSAKTSDMPQTPAAPPESITAPQPPAASPESIFMPQPPAVPLEHIRKISRRDLRILPRRYWNIANNSFLMHGYHNYNHLLLVEKDGYYLIGVPGVYSIRESHAASLFGFSRFTDEYNQELDLTDEEKNDYGTFGYWCCEIRP